MVVITCQGGRGGVCLIAGLLAGALPAGAAQVKAGPSTAATSPAAATRPSERAAEARRGWPADEIRFDALPLAEAVDFLRESSGLNIFVNWRMLESAGVTRQTPVTVRTRHVSLRKVLEMVLSSAGGTEPLDFSVSDGVITISTHKDLQGRPEIRVYDITDLLLMMPDDGALHQPRQGRRR